jgi:hypothetical protein
MPAYAAGFATCDARRIIATTSSRALPAVPHWGTKRRKTKAQMMAKLRIQAVVVVISKL